MREGGREGGRIIFDGVDSVNYLGSFRSPVRIPNWR